MTFPPPSPDGILTPGEAARRLGVSTLTLSRWVEAGVLSAAPSPSSHARYYEAEITLLGEVRELRKENEALRGLREGLDEGVAMATHGLAKIRARMAAAP